MRRLRLLPRSLPPGVHHLVVAVQEPGWVPAELATGVLVARRLLAVREVTMTLAVWGDAPIPAGIAELLAGVPLVRPNDCDPASMPFLTQVGHDARAEHLGWVRWQ